LRDLVQLGGRVAWINGGWRRRWGALFLMPKIALVDEISIE
jgi:hypothetical protein